MERLSIYGSICMSIFLIWGCGPKLQDYEPKTKQENEIKALLVEFAKARNNYDVPGIVSLLTGDCKVNFFTRELSKSEFATQFKAKDLEDYGQYSFTNPEISVTDGVAMAKLRCSQGLLNTQVFRFKMIQQGNSWMISEWDASRN
jgi:hypothetical protein